MVRRKEHVVVADLKRKRVPFASSGVALLKATISTRTR